MKRYAAPLLFFVALLFTIACTLCVRALTVPVFGGEERLKIVIDAGHGGVDGGVSGKKTGKKESDINLTIALSLGVRLEEMGFEVVQTRKTKAGLYDVATTGFKKRDMAKRKEICEGENPHLILSIHQNFYTSSIPRGGQVFYGNTQSKELAVCLQNALNRFYEREGAKGRKEMKGDFFMLQFYPPSVIVECGFLSNERDEQILTSQTGQEKIVSAILSGVISFFEGKVSG